MTRSRKSIHGHWSSRWAFVLAATGSAVGLGNVWRFPYITGENGGGAFVLVYLACVFCVGVPIMIAEIMLGRRGRQSPINTMHALAGESGLYAVWKYVGWMGVAAAFLILSFYSVVAGWTLAYIFRTGAGIFDGATASATEAVYNQLIADPEKLLAWHTIFMVMTTVVVARGVRGGLEQTVRWAMPALFIVLVVLVGYAMGAGRFADAATYLFKPDFSRLTEAGVLTAMGQAFFSLSLGMGAIMMYGSYLPENASIAKATFTIAFADTFVAVLSGLAIFPLVFAYGLAPEGGPGLIFKTLPVAFGHMPFGRFFGSLFFVLLMLAAWTSSISLLEPSVAWLVENRGISRIRASFYAGGLAWLVGIGSLFSLNVWSGYTLFGRTFFGLVEYATANVMLPLGGLFIAIFAGWRLPREASLEELTGGVDGIGYRVWRFLVRYVAPAALTLIFLNATGFLQFQSR